MKKYIKLVLAVIYTNGYGQNFYILSQRDVPLINKTFMLNLIDCDSIKAYTCPPTNNSNQWFESAYTDIAVDNKSLYFVSGWSSLYKRNIGDTTSCQYLGNFNHAINSLVSDTGGIIYAAGQQNGICALFKYQGGIFSMVGNFPAGFFASGDLFFYENRLFMTGTNSNMTSSYLVEVNISNPSLSCIYMGLQNLQPWGAFSVNNGLISKAFVIATSTVSSVKTSSLIEINIPCKSLGTVQCVYPFLINGAASHYDYNSGVFSCSATPLPGVSVTGNFSVCAGNSATLSASGANSYSWSIGSVSSSIVVTPGSNTVYTLIATSVTGCSGEYTAAVIVKPLPSITISGNTLVCGGASVIHTASGATSYTWSTGANTNTVTLSPITGSTYSVTGIGSNGCPNTATTNVKVIFLTDISVNTPTVCSGNSVTLYASNGPTTGVVYTWYPGAVNGESITIMPNATSTYSLYASSPACSLSLLVTNTVIVNPTITPIVNFRYDSPVCIESESVLPIKGVDFNANGIFSSNELNIDSSSGLLNLSSLVPGIYSITYVTAQIGCTVSGTATQTIELAPSPYLVISPGVNITPGSSITLSISGAESYTWFPGDFLSCVNCINPVASPPENIKYCVTGMLGSCSSKICVEISVSCNIDKEYSVPNSFTPNSDGNNDEFCLQGWNNCVISFNVIIFDRWGEKVFESGNPDFCWNGIYKGKPLNADVYIYVISAVSKGGFITKKGNITLIK